MSIHLPTTPILTDSKYYRWVSDHAHQANGWLKKETEGASKYLSEHFSLRRFIRSLPIHFDPKDTVEITFNPPIFPGFRWKSNGEFTGIVNLFLVTASRQIVPATGKPLDPNLEVKLKLPPIEYKWKSNGESVATVGLDLFIFGALSFSRQLSPANGKAPEPGLEIDYRYPLGYGVRIDRNGNKSASFTFSIPFFSIKTPLPTLSPKPHSLAIIGGGASATLLALQLARRSEQAALDVYVVEPGELGGGVAYSTTDPSHLLNVPAGKMSAYPNQGKEEHFLKWVQKNYPDLNAQPTTFVAREIYGKYLKAELEQLLQSHPNFHLIHKRERAAALIRKGAESFEVQLASGEKIETERVTLALGNFAPVDPPLPAGKKNPDFFKSSSRYTLNPYLEPKKYLNGKGTVLLTGTGLTTVDTVISIHKQNPDRKIIAFSRNGLLPEEHDLSTTPLSGKEAEDYLALIRVEINKEKKVPKIDNILRIIQAKMEELDRRPKEPGKNWNWRAAFDALRPITPDIWRSLSEDDRKIFLSEHSRWWDTHRHRIPTESAEAIREMIQSGTLKIVKGSLDEIQESETLQVTLKEGNKRYSFSADHLVNCTGPDSDYERLAKRDPFVASLFDKNLVQADGLKLGLKADSDGHLIGVDGVVNNLFGIGPIIFKALDWEGTAIPEIRVQAVKVADQMMKGIISST